jgi:hypothetical protein
MNHDQNSGAHHARLIPGLIVAGVGVLFLLDNLNVLPLFNWWRLWPLILIVIGVSKLAEGDGMRGLRRGLPLVVIGGIFLGINLGLIPGEVWHFWPVLLIGLGLIMLFDRDGLRFIPAFHVRPGGEFAKADAIAIFGGFKRQVSTEDFRGASYVAVFGGGQVDLRRAHIQGESALIEVSAIFGGFELRVPPNWIVVNEVAGIFGGTSDETLMPLPEAPNVKRLTVRGSAVFGGIEIKN